VCSEGTRPLLCCAASLSAEKAGKVEHNGAVQIDEALRPRVSRTCCRFVAGKARASGRAYKAFVPGYCFKIRHSSSGLHFLPV
jgi:hypothetical protein